MPREFINSIFLSNTIKSSLKSVKIQFVLASNISDSVESDC